MTKSEFLRRLEKALAPLGAQERQAALEYWEEYITEAAQEGGEEAAIANIDAPEDIARRLLAEAGMAPAPRKKRSASYWVLLVMASPIWLPLGAAAFAIVFCALIALALLALTPALIALTLLASGLCGVVLGFMVLHDGITFAFIAGVGLAALGAGGLIAFVAFPLLPRTFAWLKRHIHFRRRAKV